MLLQNTFRAFRHRDYFIFWCGLLLGHSGTLVQATAQSWLIFQLTNSPFYLGLDGLCLGLPRVLFSALGGAVVDRRDRKWLFIATQSGFFLMALFLGVMNYLGTIRVWHVLMVSALTGFAVSFEQPVRQSILHDLVPRPELPNAIALYQMVFNGSMLFGPSIGGMLIPLIDTQGCFFAAALGNLVVLVTIFLIHIAPARPLQQEKSVLRDMIQGFSLAWNTPLILALLSGLAVVSFCTKPYTQFMPVFARDILHVGAPGLGLLLMAPGAGAILGGLILASLRRYPKPHHLLFSLAVGFGCAISLFEICTNFLLALVLLYLGFTLFNAHIGGLFSPELQDAPWSLARVWDLLKHLPIPALILGLAGNAQQIRIMRANLLDELRKPYVVTARAKGLSEFRAIVNYPVRVALNPFISTIGYILPFLVSGSIIVSIVLSLPTVGPLLLKALLAQDMFLAGTIVLLLGVMTVIGTLISDILLVWIDPRIRLGE
jgi:ABC-type dipeptide/oligopeptide/nickel transport system permease component